MATLPRNCGEGRDAAFVSWRRVVAGMFENVVQVQLFVVRIAIAINGALLAELDWDGSMIVRAFSGNRFGLIPNCCRGAAKIGRESLRHDRCTSNF